jgi:hypothetical protein
LAAKLPSLLADKQVRAGAYDTDLAASMSWLGAKSLTRGGERLRRSRAVWYSLSYMAANPFRPGTYYTGQQLFGREGMLRSIRRAADDIEGRHPHAPISLHGPPGIGKTVLLRHAVKELRERKWLCGYSEAGSNAGSAVYDMLADMQRTVPSQSIAKRLFSRAQGIQLGAGPVSIGLDMRSLGNESAYTRLVDLLLRLDHTAKSEKVGVAFVLDEAHALPSSQLFLVLRAFKSLVDSSVILFMAALPGIENEFATGDPSNPYIFSWSVDYLDVQSSEAALVEPARAEGGDFDEGALAALVGFAKGHPLTLQLLGRYAWDNAADKFSRDEPLLLGADDADIAIRQARQQLERTYYLPIWYACASEDRAFLSSISWANDGLTREEALQAAKTKMAEPWRALYHLVGKGIIHEYYDIKEHHSRIMFAIPGFREFAARQ